MSRSTAIGLVALLLLALASGDAMARGGGHMGGGHWSGGHWGGGGHWAGHWNGGFNRFAFHRARFFHRPFVGPFFFGGYAAAYDGCWQVRPTVWGWRRVWVCGYPYYGYF